MNLSAVELYSEALKASPNGQNRSDIALQTETAILKLTYTGNNIGQAILLGQWDMYRKEYYQERGCSRFAEWVAQVKDHADNPKYFQQLANCVDRFFPVANSQSISHPKTGQPVTVQYLCTTPGMVRRMCIMSHKMGVAETDVERIGLIRQMLTPTNSNELEAAEEKARQAAVPIKLPYVAVRHENGMTDVTFRGLSHDQFTLLKARLGYMMVPEVAYA